jgi:hypothetical protein
MSENETNNKIVVEENFKVEKVVEVPQNETHSVMSVGDWLITLVLLSIPFVNLIMIIVWAVGSDTNKNKKNFALALLVLWGIVVLLFILLGASMFAILGSMAQTFIQ